MGCTGSTLPDKPRAKKSAAKRMALIFWDPEGILLIKWFYEGKKINSDFYVEAL